MINAYGTGPAQQGFQIAQMQQLKALALLEGTTPAGPVFIAAPWRHLAGLTSAAPILGQAHGMVLLACLWTVIPTVSGGGWTRTRAVRLAAAASVPFGGVINRGLSQRRAASLALPGGQPSRERP